MSSRSQAEHEGYHDGVGICHSLRAQVTLIPLNILRIITGYRFFYKYCLSLKKLQKNPPIWKGSCVRQILASEVILKVGS